MQISDETISLVIRGDYLYREGREIARREIREGRTSPSSVVLAVMRYTPDMVRGYVDMYKAVM